MAGECRISAAPGSEATSTHFCSARSQVRGCLNGGAKQSHNSGIGVRVDWNSSAPSGAFLANKEDRSRASNRSKVGKRAYRRARNRADKEGSAVYKGRIICSTGQRVRVSRSYSKSRQRGPATHTGLGDSLPDLRPVLWLGGRAGDAH